MCKAGRALTRVDLDCQKRSEEKISRVPYYRSETTVTGLCSKHSTHGMSTCCHLANKLALPMKVLVH